MTKLHHILAVERRVKTESQEQRTHALRQLQSPALFEGQTKTYKPLDNEGDPLPPVDDKVQFRVKDVLRDLIDSWVEKIDTIGEKHEGNTVARASVKIGDEVILADVPSTQLLFLEKELDDLRTIVMAAPVLSSDVRWTFNSSLGLHESPEMVSNRNAKTVKAVTLAPATDKHPAQVQPVNVDTVIGQYTQVRFSGQLTPVERRQLLDRIKILQAAVKQARETANTVETDAVHHGKLILDFVFDGIV
jgi:hypothetical protein